MSTTDSTQLEPLLEDDEHEEDDVAFSQAEQEECLLDIETGAAASQASTFLPTTLSLAKIILGAGMMALPKVFTILGVIPGTLVLVFVAILTWFTINGLVNSSLKTRAWSYADVVKSVFGPFTQHVVNVCTFVQCGGFLVVFLVIIADIMIGTAPDYNGMLLELLPDINIHRWFLSRPFIILLTCLLLLPLISNRNLESLTCLNVIGNTAVAAFTISAITLAAAAITTGQAYPLPLWPQLSQLGSSLMQRFTLLISTVPVVLTADACHQNIYPVISMLKPFSKPSMGKVTATALTACTAIYITLSVSALVAFGAENVDADVLNNFSIESMAPLIGDASAVVLALLVRTSFAVSLLVSFALIMFPLREVALEVAVPPSLRTVAFLPVSYALLTVVFLISVCVPSIWHAISLVGATSGTLLCFIFPSLLIYVHSRKEGWRARFRQAAAVGIVGLGAFLFVNGVVNMG